MKKIIILLISLTLIVSCLVIGASAKLFTPPTEATNCLIFNNQTIAYPYYTLNSASISVGSECLYPTLLAVYDTDNFIQVIGNNSYIELRVRRSGNNLTVTGFHTGEGETYNLYNGEGYDVLFYDRFSDDGNISYYAIVDSNYNIIDNDLYSNNIPMQNYKKTVDYAHTQGYTICYGVADEPPETEPPETEPPETEPPETETPVVPPVTPSDPGEGGHITEVITDGIIPFVGGLGSAFVMAFTSLFIYEGNINVLGIFILTMFGIALGYGVIRWITHLFRKE